MVYIYIMYMEFKLEEEVIIIFLFFNENFKFIWLIRNKIRKFYFCVI